MSNEKEVFYIAKKKSEKRWTAFPFKSTDKPEVKRGYEMKGPYQNLLQAMMAANGDDPFKKS